MRDGRRNNLLDGLRFDNVCFGHHRHGGGVRSGRRLCCFDLDGGLRSCNGKVFLCVCDWRRYDRLCHRLLNLLRVEGNCRFCSGAFRTALFATITTATATTATTATVAAFRAFAFRRRFGNQLWGCLLR